MGCFGLLGLLFTGERGQQNTFLVDTGFDVGDEEGPDTEPASPGLMDLVVTEVDFAVVPVGEYSATPTRPPNMWSR